MIDREHAVDDVLHREVLLDLVLVDGVLRLAELVLVVRLVPLLERRLAVGLRSAASSSRSCARFGQDRAVDLREEAFDALRRGRHAVGEHVRGPGRVAEEVREAVAGRDRIVEQLHVRVAAAVVVRDVVRFARGGVGLVLQERPDGGLVHRDGVAAVGGLLERRGDEVGRQRLRLRGGDRDRRLVVAEVRLELVLVVGQLLLERDELAPLRVGQPGAAALERGEPERGELLLGGALRGAARLRVGERAVQVGARGDLAEHVAGVGRALQRRGADAGSVETL